jgi:hypothetical protein
MDEKDYGIKLGSKLILKMADILNWISHDKTDKISYDHIVKEFGEILGASRAFIFKRFESGGTIYYKVTDLWTVSDKDKLCDVVIARSDFPNVIDMLENKECIYEDVGVFSEKEQNFLRSVNVLCLACVPIIGYDSNVCGFFGFNDCVTNRVFTEIEHSALKAIGSIIGTIMRLEEESNKRSVLIQEHIQQFRTLREEIDRRIAMTTDDEYTINAHQHLSIDQNESSMSAEF